MTTQLFAVGDDWHAIFRFAGSDITIIREFQERFGESERIDLETTFRCANQVANFCYEFRVAQPCTDPQNCRFGATDR